MEQYFRTADIRSGIMNRESPSYPSVPLSKPNTPRQSFTDSQQNQNISP